MPRSSPVYLGDDLMSRQPIFEVVQGVGASFLFTAKPASHKTLYEWIDGAEPETHEERVKKARAFYTHRYRWIEAVPIRDGKDAILVNWLEMEIVNPSGKTTYRNSFVTDLPVTADTVAELAACGRARWKIENEGFNTLKTKGYNLEHNFGHGSRHLASLAHCHEPARLRLSHRLRSRRPGMAGRAQGARTAQNLLRGPAHHHPIYPLRRMVRTYPHHDNRRTAARPQPSVNPNSPSKGL